MDIQKINEIIKSVDPRFRTKIWQEYGKNYVFVHVDRTDKVIKVNLNKSEMYPSRPGAWTQAIEIRDALKQQIGVEFIIK